MVWRSDVLKPLKKMSRREASALDHIRTWDVTWREDTMKPMQKPGELTPLLTPPRPMWDLEQPVPTQKKSTPVNGSAKDSR